MGFWSSIKSAAGAALDATGAPALWEDTKSVASDIGDKVSNFAGDAKEVIGDTYNDLTGETDRRFNRDEAQKARDWEEYMSNTANQRAVKDRLAAGLSPYGMQGVDGASTPSGPVAHGSNIAGGTRNVAAGLLGMLTGIAQIRNLNSTTAKNYAEAGDIGMTQTPRINLLREQATTQLAHGLLMVDQGGVSKAEQKRIMAQIPVLAAQAGLANAQAGESRSRTVLHGLAVPHAKQSARFFGTQEGFEAIRGSHAKDMALNKVHEGGRALDPAAIKRSWNSMDNLGYSGRALRDLRKKYKLFMRSTANDKGR